MKYPLFIAIDHSDFNMAQSFAILAAKQGCGLKIGLEFYTRHGMEGTKKLLDACADASNNKSVLFLDLKFHDIPNTVAGACSSALMLAPDFLTLHASGGKRMMQAAKAKIEEQGAKTKLIAVSLLTSMEKKDMKEIGLKTNEPSSQVLTLANLAKQAGVNHLVCAPHEIKMLKQTFKDELILITPGVRPLGSAKNDQRRTLTPKEAMSQGADYLVIGRPITHADDPAIALKQLCGEL